MPDAQVPGPYPFSDDFQDRVVALALLDRSFYARHRRAVDPAYFTAPHLPELVAVIAAFFDAHRAVPSRELFVDLVADDAGRRGLKSAVVDVRVAAARRVAAVPAGDAGYARERLLGWVRSQVIASTAMRLASLYEDSRRSGAPDVDAMHRAMTEAVAACAERSGDYLDYFEDLTARVYADHNALKVTTGYATLDAALEGGVDRGELLVFLGTPSMGKTSLLVGAARGALLHRYRPLVVTNEVSPRRWAARVDRAVTGKTRAEILANPRAALRQIRRLRQVQGRMFVKGYPTGTATVADIEGLVDELRDVEEFVPDVLVVDYADELRSTAYPDDFRLGVIDVYRRLRALGVSRGIPVVTASQAGKQAEGKSVVNMRDFAEAYAKSAVADIVVALCQTDEEAERKPYPECRLYGAKNREGQRRFNLRYIFRPDRGIIAPAPEDAPARLDEDVVRYGAEAGG